MSASCSYSCTDSGFHRLPQSNPDVDGVGVLVGFMATAYMTVLIEVLYYVFGFDPLLDPFREDDPLKPQSDQEDFKPNPVDVMILRRQPGNISWNKSMRNGKSSRWSGLENSLNTCVLIMNDIQLVTGFAILISGYSQLRCGLSIYHWQIVVYLAWFSSLTHLSSLTFLRQYLNARPRLRKLRVVAMFLFALMLVVSLVPTGNFSGLGFDASDSDIGSNAVCYFHGWDTKSPSFPSMIVSMLIISLSLITRIIKMHKKLSRILSGRVRRTLSSWYKRILKWLLERVDDITSKHNGTNTSQAMVWIFLAYLIKTLAYRPLLALFLVLRVTLDVFTSTAWEVGWLVLSIAWGSLHLISTRKSGGGNGDWTFGQVLPLVSLAAPLVSMVDNFSFDNEYSNTTESSDTSKQPTLLQADDEPFETQLLNSTAPSIAIEPSSEIAISLSTHDGLDRNFYKNVKWFKCLVIFSFALSLEFAIGVYLNIALVGNTALFLEYLPVWLLWTVPFSLQSFALLCLSLESLESLGKLPRALSPNRWLLLVFLFLGMTAWTAYELFFMYVVLKSIYYGTIVGFYLLCCLIGALNIRKTQTQ